MATYSGTIKAMSSKTRNTKRGPAEVYSFLLDDENWYNCGFNKPGCNKGDYVTFSAEQTQWGFDVDGKSIQVKVGNTPAPQQSSGGNRKSGGVNSRDNYWAEKDTYDKQVKEPIIHYQSSRKDAVALCIAGLKEGILPIGSGNKDKKWDTFMSMVDHVTQALYEDLECKTDILKEGGSIRVEAPEAENTEDYAEQDFEDDITF